MAICKHRILDSLAALETRRPLYAGAMPVADEVVRDVFASALADLSTATDFERADAASREASLLASLAHALLEVTYLREQLKTPAIAAAGEAARLCERMATAR